MKIRNVKSSELPFALATPAILWQVLFFYLPLFLIVSSSFLSLSDAGRILGFTLHKVQTFLQPTYLRVIFSSICLGLSNAFLCFCIAYPLAYFMAFRAKKKKNLLLFLIIIPFWTNFLLHVYAWFYMLEYNGVLNQILLQIGIIRSPIPFMNSLFATMVMMVYYYLPFMVFPLYSSLEKFDYRLIESSLDLGASWIHTLRHIILPLNIRGILAGFFLVYIPSFGEFAIPELMGGDRQMFVGSVVARYILGDQTGSLGAAFTIIACLALMLSSAFIYYIIKKIFTVRASYVAKN